jgi:hypothetical protein
MRADDTETLVWHRVRAALYKAVSYKDDALGPEFAPGAGVRSLAYRPWRIFLLLLLLLLRPWIRFGSHPAKRPTKHANSGLRAQQLITTLSHGLRCTSLPRHAPKTRLAIYFANVLGRRVAGLGMHIGVSRLGGCGVGVLSCARLCQAHADDLRQGSSAHLGCAGEPQMPLVQCGAAVGEAGMAGGC